MTEQEKDELIIELQDTIYEMLKERKVNIATILMIIEIIRLLQSMKKGEDLTGEKMLGLIMSIFGVSGDEAKTVGSLLKEIDPDFLSNLLHGLGDLANTVLK